MRQTQEPEMAPTMQRRAPDRIIGLNDDNDNENYIDDDSEYFEDDHTSSNDSTASPSNSSAGNNSKDSNKDNNNFFKAGGLFGGAGHRVNKYVLRSKRLVYVVLCIAAISVAFVVYNFLQTEEQDDFEVQVSLSLCIWGRAMMFFVHNTHAHTHTHPSPCLTSPHPFVFIYKPPFLPPCLLA